MSRPKCYAFDTGFVAFEKGWQNIRADDRGILWEHLVLDTLRTQHRDDDLFYWADKSGREIDFVIRRSGQKVDTIECKINAKKTGSKNLKEFRSRYPKGQNFILSPYVDTPFKTRSGELEYTVCSSLKGRG